MDSGFHRLKLPGFRIPDYLTWGEKDVHRMFDVSVSPVLSNILQYLLEMVVTVYALYC